MNKKGIIVLVVGLSILGIAVFFLAKNDSKTGMTASQQEKSNAKMILFYGIGCPHCENVDAFLKENNVREKVQFEELEVFSNKENAKILQEKSDICGVKPDAMGVPFLWNNGSCLSGDADIINFFKGQIGQ